MPFARAVGRLRLLSYIAPLLTEVSGFSPEHIPYILILAGLGMVIGNLLGGKLADRFSPPKTILLLLLLIAGDLLLVYFFSSNQYAALALVFLTGCITFAVAAPIQMLMIQTAVGAEMIASAVIQAGFNIGNALGAFLGGLPLVAGFSYASPNLVGVGMALTGVVITFVFIKGRKAEVAMQDLNRIS